MITTSYLRQLPILVMPLHDPDEVILPHLIACTPTLKSAFASVIINLSTETVIANIEETEILEADSFFRTRISSAEIPVGEQFAELYRFAADFFPAEQVLHLAFPDRIAFALQPEQRQMFGADLRTIRPERLPLLFMRSRAAWDTHPRHYYELETMLTRVGEMLFQQTLDFAWCHLVIQAHLLKSIMPQVKRKDMSMLAEMIVLLRDHLYTQEVDWLAWEDAFIYGRAAAEMKTEREASTEDLLKRLGYITPMLEVLREKGKDLLYPPPTASTEQQPPQ